MQMNVLAVGTNIKKYRQLKGYSQEALALESGLSQGYINQLENGKRNYTQKSIERIARALAMSVADFFQTEETGLAERRRTPPQNIKKSVYRKELFDLLMGLPEPIIEHYLTLLRIENDLWKSKKIQNHKPAGK